jgi:hypothetical protein
MNEVVSEGERLILAWTGAQEATRRARSDLTSCECDESNTRRALAAWLKPHDAKPGEKIAVWFGDNLVQVEVGGAPDGMPAGEDRVTIRTRGKRGL